jgi:hypothetical protein
LVWGLEISPLKTLIIPCYVNSKGLNIETDETSLYYGKNRTIQNRVLKFTYGTAISSEWRDSDTRERLTESGRIKRFWCLARRGTQVNVTDKFTDTFGPVNPKQTRLPFDLYYTEKYSAEYLDDEGVQLLGKWLVVCIVYIL